MHLNNFQILQRAHHVFWPDVAGPSSFNSPASWMRTPSQTGPGSAPRSTDERRQRAREAQAEALAVEYDRAANSGYEEVLAALPTAPQPCLRDRSLLLVARPGQAIAPVEIITDCCKGVFFATRKLQSAWTY